MTADLSRLIREHPEALDRIASIVEAETRRGVSRFDTLAYRLHMLTITGFQAEAARLEREVIERIVEPDP